MACQGVVYMIVRPVNEGVAPMLALSLSGHTPTAGSDRPAFQPVDSVSVDGSHAL